MKRKLLLVENDLKIYEWLADCLASDTFNVLWAQTTHEARRRSMDEWFDLVLLDGMLSELDSGNTLRWFKTLHPFLPLVLLDDPSQPALAVTGFRPDARLHKPLDAAALLETIDQLLAESHSARVTGLSDALFGMDPCLAEH